MKIQSWYQAVYVQLSLAISVHFHSLGEHQQPHFPGLTRGLVAVLLYWDGKRCIANSLRALIQSRQGKTWTLELRSVSGWWADQSSLFWVLLEPIRLKGVCTISNLLFSHNLMQLLSCLFLKHNHFCIYFCWIIGIYILLSVLSCYFTFWQCCQSLVVIAQYLRILLCSDFLCTVKGNVLLPLLKRNVLSTGEHYMLVFFALKKEVVHTTSFQVG